MKKLPYISFVGISLVVLLLASNLALAASPWPADAGIEIGQEGETHGLPDGFEPSGAIWHSVRQTLILVDDSGIIAELDPEHGVLATWELDEDLEGITLVDPHNDLVYLAVEHPDGVLEFDLATGALTGRSWDLTPWLDGPDNHGLEALTWVEGSFYAGLQEDGNIFIFDLMENGGVQLQGTIAPHEGRDDLSGLHFDSCTGILFAIHDSHDIIVEMNADGSFLREYQLAGDNQEGVALVGESTSGDTNIFIAQDSGEVWMYGQYAIDPCGSLSPSGEMPGSPLVLLTCRPNPFNPRTEIHFELDVSQFVELSVHDIRGQLVQMLVSDSLDAGNHHIVWNGCDHQGLAVASGVYFSHIKTGTSQDTVKLVLAR